MEKLQSGLITDDLMGAYNLYYEELVTHPGVKEYLAENIDIHSKVFHDWYKQRNVPH